MEALGGAGARGGGQRPPWRTAAQSEKNLQNKSLKEKNSGRRGTKRERASGVRRRKEGQGSANINNHPPPPRLLLVKQTLHRLRNSSTPV